MAKAKPAAPALTPRAVLFGNPTKASPRLAPDGTRMAYLAPVDNVLNVWVGPIDGSNYQPVTHDTDRGIRVYRWAEDNQHILYLQDVGGNENWRLYAVHLDSGTIRDLTPFDNVQAQLIAHDKRFPSALLVGLNKDNPQVHDAYRLDLVSGELTQVAQNPGTFMAWLADAELKVRGALAATPDGGTVLLVRPDESADWQKLVTWDPDNSASSEPLAFTGDGKGLYLQDSRDANAARLVRLDLAKNKIKVLAADPQYDMGSVLIDPDTHAIQMVSFNRARQEWVVLDQTIADDIAAIRTLHPGDFSIVSRDHADTTWLVAFVADNGPLAYYRFDRASHQGTFLFDNQPELAQYPLAAVEPISFPSRDGLTIHGYITFPPGHERQHLPLVLNVHGGPWARDSWGY